jgi:hypothetical protein
MVREKSPDKPEEVLLNLAHVELAMVQHHDHITTPLLYIFSRVDLVQPFRYTKKTVATTRFTQYPFLIE